MTATVGSKMFDALDAKDRLGVPDEEWERANSVIWEMTANGSKSGAALILVETIRAAIAQERAECAKVCEARYMGDNNREDAEAKRCAAAIRARSEA